MLDCLLRSQLTLVYNHKIFTKLPNFEVLHGTTKAKVMSPCSHLYTNHPIGKRLQRFTKTPPSYLKSNNARNTTTNFWKIAWNNEGEGIKLVFPCTLPPPSKCLFSYPRKWKFSGMNINTAPSPWKTGTTNFALGDLLLSQKNTGLHSQN